MITILATILPMLAAPGCDGLRITTVPERPRQGALFRVRVTGADGLRLTGSAAGEPLHFTVAGAVHEAIAAAPIDGASPLRVVVSCDGRSGGADSSVVRIPLARANYPLER